MVNWWLTLVCASNDSLFFIVVPFEGPCCPLLLHVTEVTVEGRKLGSMWVIALLLAELECRTTFMCYPLCWYIAVSIFREYLGKFGRARLTKFNMYFDAPVLM